MALSRNTEDKLVNAGIFFAAAAALGAIALGSTDNKIAEYGAASYALAGILRVATSGLKLRIDG